MTRVGVPKEFDERQFHDFAGAYAEAILDEVPVGRLGPAFSDPRNLRLLIKGLVIDRLPSKYVMVTPYTVWERFRAAGRHRFLRPIPKEGMLGAFKEAGFEWSIVPPAPHPEADGS